MVPDAYALIQSGNHLLSKQVECHIVALGELLC